MYTSKASEFCTSVPAPLLRRAVCQSIFGYWYPANTILQVLNYVGILCGYSWSTCDLRPSSSKSKSSNLPKKESPLWQQRTHESYFLLFLQRHFPLAGDWWRELLLRGRICWFIFSWGSFLLLRSFTIFLLFLGHVGACYRVAVATKQSTPTSAFFRASPCQLLISFVSTLSYLVSYLPY